MGTKGIQIVGKEAGKIVEMLNKALADEWLARGEHVLTWDGATDLGTLTAAGVYFVRLEGEGKTRVGRVVRRQATR